MNSSLFFLSRLKVFDVYSTSFGGGGGSANFNRKLRIKCAIKFIDNLIVIRWAAGA